MNTRVGYRCSNSRGSEKRMFHSRSVVTSSRYTQAYPRMAVHNVPYIGDNRRRVRHAMIG